MKSGEVEMALREVIINFQATGMVQKDMAIQLVEIPIQFMATQTISGVTDTNDIFTDPLYLYIYQFYVKYTRK